VSGLAAAYPDRVAAVVREPSEAGAIELGELRASVERFPRHAALKFILGLRGVPVREDVRRPLRQLSDGEREELRGWLESS
jgi:dihydrodipicolinate synthase/N-acetylneuraminate lyase